MVDKEQIVKNIVPVVLIILIAGLGTWVVVSVGLPFLDNPDTFEPLEVVSLQDTEEGVIINLTDPTRKGELDVLVDGTERQWNENNTITVNKSDSPVIALESYPENEGLFGRYEYPMGEADFNLNYSDEILEGESNAYRLQSTISNPDRIEWFTNGELQKVNSEELIYEFGSTGEQEIEYAVQTENITYTRSETVQVFDPGAIILDVNITSTDLVSFESFDMNITEVTNKSVEQLEIDWGDGENDTVGIGERIRYWYRTPGQYNVTISGQSTTSDANVTENLQINVSEREDEADISRINVNVFDREGTPIPNATVSIGSVTEETDGSGFVRIPVQRGEYNIQLDKAGYVPDNRTVLVTSDVVIDESLSRVTPERPEVVENDTGVDIGDQLPDPVNNTNASEIPINTDFDSLTLSTFEQLNGTGTSSNPYKISNYTQLQSIRVQPNANYQLTQDIDASLSFQQDLIERVEDEPVAGAGDRTIFLPYISSEPEDLTIRVGDREIRSNEYDVVVEEGVGGRPQDQRVFVVFSQDGDPVPPSQKLDVEPSESVLATYNVPDSKARGFRPIDANEAVINVEGNGYRIENMYINRPLEDNVGLIRNMQGGELSNIRMTGEIVGGDQTGGFVGSASTVTLDSLNMSGVISGRDEVGGIAGQLSGSQVTKSNTFAGVFGYSEVGGIAGSITDNQNPTEITESFTRSTFITPVLGFEEVGGVVGSATDSRITNTYSSGFVIGVNNETGGVGGVAGRLEGQSNVTSVYSASRVSGSGDSSEDVGGVVGRSEGSNVETAYWDTSISGDGEEGVGTNNGVATNVIGLTTSEMRGDTVNSMSEFNFDDVWTNRGGEGEYPELQSQFEEHELTITLQENAGNTIESPIITILNTDGEQVATESPQNAESIETSFTLIEGTYTVEAGSAEYSQETDIRLVDDRTINIGFGN